MRADLPLDCVEAALSTHGSRPKRQGSAVTALCPAHDDTTPSLSVNAKEDGTVLLRCQAGCATADVLTALGLDWSDLFASPPERQDRREILDTYDYVDEAGALLFQVVRYMPKKFVQRRPDGAGGWEWSLNGVRRVPFHLPDLTAAIEAGRVVFVTEGEKDVERLRSQGIPATCNAGGAGKWAADWGKRYFTGAKVAILPDNDEPGRRHAEDVAQSLYGSAAEIRVVELPGLPEKGDVSDWLNAGHTLDELRELVKATAAWLPDERASNAQAEYETGPRLVGVLASMITPSRPEWEWTG